MLGVERTGRMYESWSMQQMTQVSAGNLKVAVISHNPLVGYPTMQGPQVEWRIAQTILSVSISRTSRLRDHSSPLGCIRSNLG